MNFAHFSLSKFEGSALELVATNSQQKDEIMFAEPHVVKPLLGVRLFCEPVKK